MFTMARLLAALLFAILPNTNSQPDLQYVLQSLMASQAQGGANPFSGAQNSVASELAQQLVSNVPPSTFVNMFGKAMGAVKESEESKYVTALGLPCDPAEKRFCFEKTTTTTTTTPMGLLQKKIKEKKEAEREELVRIAEQQAAEREWNPFEEAANFEEADKFDGEKVGWPDAPADVEEKKRRNRNTPEMPLSWEQSFEGSVLADSQPSEDVEEGGRAGRKSSHLRASLAGQSDDGFRKGRHGSENRGRDRGEERLSVGPSLHGLGFAGGDDSSLHFSDLEDFVIVEGRINGRKTAVKEEEAAKRVTRRKQRNS